MTDLNTELLRFNGKIGPQYLDTSDKSGGLDGTMKPITREVLQEMILLNFPNTQNVKDSAVLAKLADLEAKTQAITESTLDVNVLNQPDAQGISLQEQKTDADAVAGKLTFSETIRHVDIYNQDSSDGVFNINNLAIRIPANTFFQAEIGGTPSSVITVMGSKSYVIGRYA